MSNARRVLIAAVLILSVLPAAAQLNSDSVPNGRIVPVRESVESQLEDARWRIGPFRVDPDLKLGDIGYNDNVTGATVDEEKVDDYTATIGLGVRTIAPIGNRTYLRIDAMPEYTWYQELEERRRFGFDLDGSLLWLFNRMSIELYGRSSDFIDQVTSEDPTAIPRTEQNIRASADVEVVRRVFLFGEYEALDTTYEPEDGDTDYALLDRDETASRIGVRYQFRPRFDVRMMYETTESDFPNDPQFQENEGDAILAGFTYDRDALFVNAVGGNRTIEYPGSGLEKFEEFTGSLFASWRFARRTSLQARISQRPQYSTFVDNPYFLESRQGARLVVPMGHRFLVFGGAETGKNEYQAPVNVGGALVERTDDVSNWQAGIGITVFRSAVLTLSMTADDFDSNLDTYDREVVTTTIDLSLGSLFF